MSQVFQESGLEFSFPNDWVVKKYDEHRFYHYLAGLGFKGVDLIAITPERKLILIEVKNYIDRFPQDGINPTETLINNTFTFSETFGQKFNDTFQLLQIVQKYFNRKKWYRWLALPISKFLPFSTLIKLDWGFWTIANDFFKNKEIHLILWLETAPELSENRLSQIHQTIYEVFLQQLPNYSFQISNLRNNDLSIEVSFLND